MSQRHLTDDDAKQIATELAAILSPTHRCNFSPEAVKALTEFAERIKEPEVREGIVNVSRFWIEGTNTARRWTIRMLFIGAAALVMLGLWSSAKQGGPTP